MEANEHSYDSHRTGQMGVTTKGIVSIIFTPLVRGIESPQKQCCFRGLNEVLLSGTQTSL